MVNPETSANANQKRGDVPKLNHIPCTRWRLQPIVVDRSVDGPDGRTDGRGQTRTWPTNSITGYDEHVLSTAELRRDFVVSAGRHSELMEECGWGQWGLLGTGEGEGRRGEPATYGSPH